MKSPSFLVRRAVRDLRVGVLATRVVAATAARRLLHGPKRPQWSVRFEVVNEVIRAVVALGHREMTLEPQREVPLRPLSRGVLRKLSWRRGTLAGMPTEEHTPRDWKPSDLVWLHLHGGAYAMGSPASHRWIAARIALSTGARCILPEYRKAPECPYPAAIDDVLRAYQALLADGVSPSNLVLGGDSAG
ncbi:MAG TPA: alpha/beta hydrolase fold domain-containing protein, partial [Polyangiales bacterium]|nr:alpha/beta hydrolase fold domain-containing protein [Polyangiales bacterium]